MKKFKCDQCRLVIDQVEVMVIPVCPKCGTSIFMNEQIEKKSDLEKAIEWWNSIPVFEKGLLIHDTFNPPLNQRIPEEVTGREIEQIWRKETQQDSLNSYSDLGDEMFALPKEKRPQVDFEMLKETIEIINNELLLLTIFKENLNLFFDLLSKSSTFAHKAHKSLNKLMK